MKNRENLQAWRLRPGYWAAGLVMFVTIGCGRPVVQQPTTPEEIEEVRQWHAEISHRERTNQ